jgi:hypothetical protein
MKVGDLVKYTAKHLTSLAGIGGFEDWVGEVTEIHPSGKFVRVKWDQYGEDDYLEHKREQGEEYANKVRDFGMLVNKSVLCRCEPSRMTNADFNAYNSNDYDKTKGRFTDFTKDGYSRAGRDAKKRR